MKHYRIAIINFERGDVKISAMPCSLETDLQREEYADAVCNSAETYMIAQHIEIYDNSPWGDCCYGKLD